MKEFNSNIDIIMNHLSIGEISIIIKRWTDQLKNDINLLNYLETSIKNEKNNLTQNEIQTILSELYKLKIDSINVKKQIEEFSINFSSYHNYQNIENNQIENDKNIKQTINNLNKKYENILNKINSFINNIPTLVQLKDNFISGQIKTYKKNNNKKNNNSLSFLNNIIKNAISRTNRNIKKGKMKSERNYNSYNYLDNSERKIKLDVLRNKIRNIKINFEQNQLDTNNYTYNNYDNNDNLSSNKYIKDFQYNNLKNDTFSNSNISNDLNLTNASKDKILCITKRKSFIKRENEKIISNCFIHNSCNNSCNNLNIINLNHNYENSNNTNINNTNINNININNINNSIPNKYHKNKNQINSLRNQNITKMNTNPNEQDILNKGLKSIKNYKSFNFPLKDILFKQKIHKIIKFKKIKPNIMLKDKEKINIHFTNNTPKSQNPNKINNLYTYNKVLHSKPINNKKRSYSEYYLKPIQKDIYCEKENNISLNNNENKIKDFSLDNLNMSKFEIQNKNKNLAKKRKAIIRNRTINIFNENSSIGEAIGYNKNISFTFGNRNRKNNNKIDLKNININEKLINDYDFGMNPKEENKKLKNEIYQLKKEVENIKNICQTLTVKVTRLEEQNEALKKENKTILKLLNMKNL